MAGSYGTMPGMPQAGIDKLQDTNDAVMKASQDAVNAAKSEVVVAGIAADLSQELMGQSQDAIVDGLEALVSGAGVDQSTKRIGGAHGKGPKQLKRRSLCTMIFFPFVLFALLYADLCFKIHYNLPILCWTLAALGLIVVLMIGGIVFKKAQVHGFGPSWVGFLFLSSLFSAIAGPVLGDINYWTNFAAYYDLVNLNQYQSVDPMASTGQAMMDAGVIRFKERAGLDLSKSVHFVNLDTYCAVPIVNYETLIAGPNATVASYDFWAVGLNCCPRNTTKQVVFNCGAVESLTARDGLRLMDEEQRDYFRLAVQQAEAQFKITAKHPLFFYWTEDAHADMHEYWVYGNRYFFMGIFAFFSFQIFLLILATTLAGQVEFHD